MNSYIGASVPVNRVATTPEVAHHAQALTEACNLIAGPQVRNVATLGGNVAHALPAADGTIALLALDAKAEIASSAPVAVLGGGDSAESKLNTRLSHSKNYSSVPANPRSNTAKNYWLASI